MMNRHKVDITLISFLIVSVLIHLVVLVATNRIDMSMPEQTLSEPVSVEFIEPTTPSERELSKNLAAEVDAPNPDAQRLGDAERMTEIDRAPVGDHVEDVSPIVSTPTEEQSQQDVSETARKVEVDLPEADSQDGEIIIQKDQEGVEYGKLPSVAQLYRVPSKTRERLTEESVRNKYRENVEDADAVWLNTRNDILFSFFRRFKDNVYLVWNYPSGAALDRESGECLLKVEISRKGTVNGVELIESTGHSRLDQEAISAVRKGSPFGPLPEAFEKEVLKLYVVFQYNLSNQVVF